jgi:DNA polymerase-3 subunit delta'
MNGAPVLDAVVGQPRAVAQLRAAVDSPVHAYLFVGPPGSGKRAAAQAFSAALLCPRGGCGECDVCRRVLAGVHPDVARVERTGPFITVAQAREIQRLALRSPNEGDRKVLVLTDFHLVREAGPTLLKILEEPPASTVFVILADDVPPELVTIASRCVQVDFAPLTDADVASVLVAAGVSADVAAEVSSAARGRLDRARRLAADPDFAARRDAWLSVPQRLDGTGAAVATLAEQLVVVATGAAEATATATAQAEAASFADRGGVGAGESGMTKRQAAEAQRRELRRLRMDELDLGFATLAGAYRDALVSGTADPAACVAAIDAIQAAAQALERNPNELLLLQALLLRLPPVAGGARKGAGRPA